MLFFKQFDCGLTNSISDTVLMNRVNSLAFGVFIKKIKKLIDSGALLEASREVLCWLW